MNRSSAQDHRGHRPRVLCVDDEVQILEGLAAVMRRRFDVTLAESGEQALRILESSEPFLVILSDFRMPGMDGAEFLGRARAIAPDAVRILLTGQASLEGAIATINRGFAFRFLSKPSPPEELMRAVDDAIEQARLITADRRLLEGKLAELSSHLLRAERLATLGTMASAVGHELNNILAVFDCAVRFTEERAKEGLPPEEEDLVALGRMRDHLATHARSLLAFGRPPPAESDDVDLSQIVRETAGMLASAGLVRGGELRLDLPAAPVALRAARGALEQILINLLKNAVDATTKGGGRRILVTVKIDDEGVLCSIEDNGCGIPTDKLAAIFEPYYTTKPATEGTGLGLFVVRQLIGEQRGRLSVSSEVGRGTSFTLRFPMTEPRTK